MWGSCFSFGSRRLPPRRLTISSLHSSSHTTHLTHLITTHLTPLIRRLGRGCLSVWQAQYTEHPGGAAARVATAWAAASFRVAGALHRAFWRSCGARGRRCLSCGRRSTQSILQELRRAWPPLGPRLPFVWQAQYTEHPGGAAARVAAAWAAAAVRVAGALHRASWRSCGARGRRLGRGWLSHTIFHTQLCHTPSLTHHLSHTIFVTPLCHTPSFTHQLSYHFVTHHLSHTIFDTPPLTHHLLHTIFHTPSLTRHL